MLPQNKISGMSVAWGRAKWKSLNNGRMGYVFPEDDSYQIRVTQQYMAAEGFTEDDLYDCIEQVEMKYGGPGSHRVPFGLMPNSGYSNLGLTVVSRTNPSISCVFTPTSTEDNDCDGYFEWYYSRESAGVDNIQQYLSTFDRATGGRHTNVNVSPITLPGYQEASDRSWNILEDGERDTFLRQLWNYHKTTSKGFKLQMEQDLRPVWLKVVLSENNRLDENVATKSPMARQDMEDAIWAFIPEEFRELSHGKRVILLVDTLAEILAKNPNDKVALEDLSDEELIKVVTFLF